jgi:hypothetical protein
MLCVLQQECLKPNQVGWLFQVINNYQQQFKLFLLTTFYHPFFTVAIGPPRHQPQGHTDSHHCYLPDQPSQGHSHVIHARAADCCLFNLYHYPGHLLYIHIILVVV